MLKRLLRYIIALIFIASGFVKAVDLKGFSFKLEEYFSPSVFNLAFFEQYALHLATLVVVLELALGFMLLMKIRLKATLYALIALCVFFGFLTFYSAYYNVVTDCGCFGDAMKMTPWQSFWKDIALLVGLIILVFLYKNYQEKNDIGCVKMPILGIFILIMIYVMYRGIAHEPLIDFRAYKIGTDLNAERQKIDSDPSIYKTFYSIKNSKTGEVKKVDQDEYINKKYWQDTSWQIEEGKTTSEIVKQGYDSEIKKLRLETPNGEDITAQILAEPKAILVFVYKPKEASTQLVAEVQNLVMHDRFAKVYGVSTQQDFFNKIPNLMMDEVAIKTIARSNPFVLVLKKGKIVEKLGAKDYLEEYQK
ncbi:DoxX family protein [Chryseobacterium sp. POL2]|uniref:BT_3928 family protein n=1 Tax=Chryseobacterium sp. POL2 TaxID=2713414 RepID=UPI0013E13635|nr:BT_3928 family protein [Chryseobacterium sp. POL2]QIG90734.1 DoxX family protein [Chryseobacterium sp. POL2]